MTGEGAKRSSSSGGGGGARQQKHHNNNRINPQSLYSFLEMRKRAENYFVGMRKRTTEFLLTNTLINDNNNNNNNNNNTPDALGDETKKMKKKKTNENHNEKRMNGSMRKPMRAILTASISSQQQQQRRQNKSNNENKKSTSSSSETTTPTGDGDNDDENENLPDPNSYGFKALQRRFNDLSSNKVEITGEDIRVALEKLKFPASRDSVLSFMNKITKKRKERFEDCPTLTFREFQVYAIKRERELLQTFRQFDKQNLGYLTPWQLKRVLFALGRWNATNKEVDSMVERIKRGEGAFSKGKGLFSPESLPKSSDGKGGFVSMGKAIDFAEFRDFLLLSSAADLGDVVEVWGRSVTDLNHSFVTVPKGASETDKRKAQAKAVSLHLLVGAISGGVSRTVVAPLERVKIEYMLDSSKIATDGGVLGSLKRIVRTEGAPALFRGNSLNVLRIAPTKAVEFFVYDTYKARRLKTRQKDQTGNEKDDDTNTKPAAGDLSGSERMIGGSVASMCGTALTHPIDTLRSRVSGTGMRLEVAWSELIKNEGPKALWKGLGANMIRVAPYGAINFFVYDYCKQQYKKFRVRFLDEDESTLSQSSNPLPTLCFGALAGAAAQTGVYPIELVQRRMQVQGMKTLAQGAKNAKQYKNVVHGIIQIARAEGVPALYAGLIPNYTKIFPSAAVSFYVYELLKELWGLQ
jgi:solute carrier family 25 phosphate transporter 23/24/25/41